MAGQTASFDTRNAARMDLAVLRRNMPCTRSLHKNLELVHVGTGELRVLIEDERVTLRAGETLIIGGFTIHEFVPPEDEVKALRVKLAAQWLEAPFWNDEERERMRALFSRSFVLGQIRPGIPVWQTGAESRFPGVAYVIFPGNVGTENTLREAVEILMDK